MLAAGDLDAAAREMGSAKRGQGPGPCRAAAAGYRAGCLANWPGLAWVCLTPGGHALTKAFLCHRHSLLYAWRGRKSEGGREGAFSPWRAGQLALTARRWSYVPDPRGQAEGELPTPASSWGSRSCHIWCISASRGRDGPSQAVLHLQLSLGLDVSFSHDWRPSIARPASTSSHLRARLTVLCSCEP